MYSDFFEKYTEPHAYVNSVYEYVEWSFVRVSRGHKSRGGKDFVRDFHIPFRVPSYNLDTRYNVFIISKKVG